MCKYATHRIAMAEKQARNKKEDRKKKPQGKNIMANPISKGGHN